MTPPPPIPGFARQWTECKTCGNVAYYDYTPGGLGRPILTLPCGHDMGQKFNDCINRINEEEALQKLKEKNVLPTRKCIVKDCKNHEHQGDFVGNLCAPCHHFISEGSGTCSQAYRNALNTALAPADVEVLCKEVDTYEVCLYLGSQEGYEGPFFDEDSLVKVIGDFQKQNGTRLPIRVTTTRFVDGSYNEKGWECAAICYPRWPQHPKAISDFMELLARHLVIRLKQNRISVKGPTKTHMFYRKGDEVKEEVVVQTTTIKDGYL